jgi:hypothetical protein
MRQKDNFFQTVLPVVVAVLVATILYRRLGVRVPGWTLAQTIEEKVGDTLGELNQREQSEGRAPFVLTRIVNDRLTEQAGNASAWPLA